MTKQSPHSNPSRRFLISGGAAGAASAAAGSFVIVVLAFIFVELRDYWQSGSFDGSLVRGLGLRFVLPLLAVSTLIGLTFSVLPAFLGGLILAWFMHQKAVAVSQNRRLGWLIGSVAGIAASATAFLAYDWFGRNSHAGYGYNAFESVTSFLGFGIFCVVIAGAAGAWTQWRMQKRLSENSLDRAG